VKKVKLSSLPKGFFSMQNHYRGKSVHTDLRIKANGHLDGWTIASQEKGAIKEPVSTIEEANKQNNKPSNWKFRPDMPPTKHVFATPKPQHPLEWLTQVSDVHQEGEVGATRFEEGVFSGLDQGLIYFGTGGKGSHNTNKPWFYEYFIRGKKFKGKLVFRLLGAREGWKKIPEGQVHWEAWIAADEYPYILSRRQREKKDWLPPEGESALPPELEALVPSNLQYWKMKTSKERKFKILDELYNYFIDEGVIAARKLPEDKKLSMEGKEADFILQYEWWKGPEVVRKQRQGKFFIKLFDGQDVVAIDFQKKYPISDEGVAVTKHKVLHGPLKGMKPIDWKKFEGQIPSGEPAHPKAIKELPLNVDILDKGKVQVIEDSPTFLSLQFKGKKLKGYYVLVREAPEQDFWLFQKSKLPTQKGKII